MLFGARIRCRSCLLEAAWGNDEILSSLYESSMQRPLSQWMIPVGQQACGIGGMIMLSVSRHIKPGAIGITGFASNPFSCSC